MCYRWYKILHDDYSLQQGDLILSCPIVKPPNIYKLDEIYDTTAHIKFLGIKHKDSVT